MHTIVSAWVLIPLANYNPAIFSVHPGRLKALIIPACCSYLTIRLILISEQPTNTS